MAYPRLALIVSILPLLPGVALADAQHPYLANKHSLYAGVYDQSSDALLMAQRGDFEPLKFEFDDIGLSEDYTSWMLEYHYRLSDNWQLSASAYQFSQGGGRALERTLNYAGTEFDVGTLLSSDIKINTYIIDAMYRVYSSDRAEISLGAGIHALDNKLTLNSRLTVDGEVVNQRQRASASILAPLPNLRASGFYAFNDKWSVLATAGWLSLTVDNIDGDFRYGHLRGQYQLAESLGLSLGYQWVQVGATENLRNGVNFFDLEFTGATAAVTYTF